MIYSIEAIDSFFFRTPAPFEAGGETNLVKSLFPPLPGTYAGMLKPFVPVDENQKRKKFRIQYNGILLNDEFCFPQPLDMAAIPDRADGKKAWRLEAMQLALIAASNFPLPVCLTYENKGDEKIKEAEEIYIRRAAMEAYVKGEAALYEGFPLSDQYTKEGKLGIAIDADSNTAKQKHIYQIQMIRPQTKESNLKLAFETNDISISQPACVRVGGEGKIAAMKCFQEEPLRIPPAASDASYFKLYFATPAIFKNGWLPGWIDIASKEGKFSHRDKSISVRLIAAAVGRMLPAGGFGYELCDTSGARCKYFHPKEMRYAIPAGSVYYFQITKGRFQDAVRLFHQRCISDYRDGERKNYGFKRPEQPFLRLNYCDRGFGYALVGSVSKEQEDVLSCTR